MVMVSCSSNNGGFACAATCIAAFLFLYLLLFFQALNETKTDIDFVTNQIGRVNNCLEDLAKIDVAKIEAKMKTDQQKNYETMLILLFIYMGGYCLCILPSSICLLRMRSTYGK